jgi:hypothetical protein
MSRVGPTEIRAAFEGAFDQAIVFHGFADHMRDYDLYIYATADPRAGAPHEHLRYRFTHCVRATATTALTPEIWRGSLDDHLLDDAPPDPDGYVWGVRWQNLYPGMLLLPPTAETERWGNALGIPFHEATIQADGHKLSLVFSDLIVDRVQPGHVSFAVRPRGS